jgi:hypothetical protein
LQADAADPNSRDWQNLQRLVGRALPGVAEELLASDAPVLLTDPGLLGRYKLVDTWLQQLRDRLVTATNFIRPPKSIDCLIVVKCDAVYFELTLVESKDVSSIQGILPRDIIEKFRTTINRFMAQDFRYVFACLAHEISAIRACLVSDPFNLSHLPDEDYRKKIGRETWDLQRREDAIDARTALDPTDPDHLSEAEAKALKAREAGAIPLPPKYASADFVRPSYWSLRGKLDLPKERFFGLPHCERDGDATQVVGWAGLDHLRRAQAIAGWYLARKEQDGWGGPRLTPLLMALDELLPWLKQWHNDLHPELGERMGDYHEGFLLEELRQLGIPRDTLGEWRPPAAARGRRRA